MGWVIDAWRWWDGVAYLASWWLLSPAVWLCILGTVWAIVTLRMR